MSADLAPHGADLILAMPRIHAVPAPEPDDLTWHQADELTINLRRGLVELRGAVEQVTDLVNHVTAQLERAWAMRADQVLGYDDFEAYVAERLGGLGAIRLPVPERVQLVMALYGSGERMSVRGASRVMGIADQTGRADIRRATVAVPGTVVQDEPAAPGPTSAEDTRVPSKTSQALADLRAAGPRGLTAAELAARHPDWACPWRVASELHRTRRITRLADMRSGHGVYCHPDHVGGRDVQPHGRAARAA